MATAAAIAGCVAAGGFGATAGAGGAMTGAAASLGAGEGL